MSRIAIFASYDKNGIIHDYVIEYLKYLKEIADKIIFIADNYADKQEQNKLKGLVDYVKFSTHGEYDFGSYKRGYYFAVKIMELSGLNCKVNPIPSSAYPTKATRPFYSVLDKTSIKEIFGIVIPHWEYGLKRCLFNLEKMK